MNKPDVSYNIQPYTIVTPKLYITDISVINQAPITSLNDASYNLFEVY